MWPAARLQCRAAGALARRPRDAWVARHACACSPPSAAGQPALPGRRSQIVPGSNFVIGPRWFQLISVEAAGRSRQRPRARRPRDGQVAGCSALDPRTPARRWSFGFGADRGWRRRALASEQHAPRRPQRSPRSRWAQYRRSQGTRQAEAALRQAVARRVSGLVASSGARLQSRAGSSGLQRV